MNAQELPKSITELLRGIDSTDDPNKTYVLAATLNLYLETMRRIHGRVLLHPGDVRAVLDMAYTMIVNPPVSEVTYQPESRGRELTTTEENQLLNAIAEKPMTARRT